MKHIPYKQQKKTFDDIAMRYIARKIFDDIGSSDAANEGLIDTIGNEVSKADETNEWAFTSFDRFILALKQEIGADKLKSMLSPMEWVTKVDSLRLLNSTTKPLTNNEIAGYSALISKIDEIGYLPRGVARNDTFVQDDDEEFEFGDFSERLSFAFTVVNFLLYALKESDVPTSIDFEHNICPSVELTFYSRPFDDYSKIKQFLLDNEMIETKGVTPDGIRFIHSVAQLIAKHDLCSNENARIEDQTRNWRALAGVR